MTTMWTEVRLDQLAQPVTQTIDPSDLGGETVLHFSIPALEATGEPAVEPARSIESNKQLLVGGEVIISKLNPRKARVFLVPASAPHRMLCSGEFIVLRPLHRRRAKFIYYLVSAESTRQLLDSAVQSVTRSHQRIRPEVLTKLKVQVPPADRQLPIANYLDAETTRIDTLIAEKHSMIDLLEERLIASRDERIRAVSTDYVPLMHLTDPLRPIVYGIVQAGQEDPDGIPYIKTGDMSPLVPSKLSRCSPQVDLQYARARVHPGDIVIAMRASIGLPVVIPPDLPTANLTQGTARVAVRRGVSREWLFHALRTHYVQEQCVDRAVGTTFKTLNIWDLRRLQIPYCESDDQQRLAKELDTEEATTRRAVGALRTQIALLVEHRQGLITAAVTGEIDIPGVAA